jgi:hypothetical protein
MFLQNVVETRRTTRRPIPEDDTFHKYSKCFSFSILLDLYPDIVYVCPFLPCQVIFFIKAVHCLLCTVFLMRISTFLTFTIFVYFFIPILYNRPPLWSSGQSFWRQVQRSWVRFPALPDFLRGSGSGMGSTQPCEDN